MLMMLVGILLLMLGAVATQHFLGVKQTSPFAASSPGSTSADRKQQQTIGVTAPTIHRDLLYGKNVGPTISQDEYYYETCRRFPLWLGNLSEVYKRYSVWVAQRHWGWLDEAHETLGTAKTEMEECMEAEFLEYMKTWPE